MKRITLLAAMFLTGYYPIKAQVLTRTYQLNSVRSVCDKDTEKNIGKYTYTFILFYSPGNTNNDSGLSRVTIKTSEGDNSEFRVLKIADSDTNANGVNKNYILQSQKNGMVMDFKVTAIGSFILAYSYSTQTCVDTYFQSKK